MKLEFKNVTKQYGEVNAVNKVNCVMEKGIYGLLGVNGAGKTTLMRMLCTIVQSSEGQILWNGKDIWKLGGEYREVLGYLPQDFGYYPDLTVYDYMMYISSIKGLKMPFARKKVKQLLNQVGMEKFSKRKMKNLSGGMVRRVGIAQAMLNDPQILVLDEPTAGLDPNERIRFRNLISELSEERLVRTLLEKCNQLRQIEKLRKSCLCPVSGSFRCKLYGCLCFSKRSRPCVKMSQSQLLERSILKITHIRVKLRHAVGNWRSGRKSYTLATRDFIKILALGKHIR